MRDCFFLVADKNMEESFDGFLSRNHVHETLGTSQFQYNKKSDLLADRAGNDPGVYTRAHEWPNIRNRTHRHAVIALDEEWEGTPGADAIIEHIANNMLSNGWKREDFEIVVMRPEFEIWLWQDNPHVDNAFCYRGEGSLRSWLKENGWWPESSPKPLRPKEAVEAVGELTGTGQSSSTYRKITSRVTIKNCEDASFGKLVAALQRWFPPEWRQ